MLVVRNEERKPEREGAEGLGRIGLSDVIYMHTRVSFPFTDRDYVQYRGVLVNEHDGEYFCLYRDAVQ